MPMPVSDFGSNPDENIVHAAKTIARSPHRRSVFDIIYTGKKRIKSVEEIRNATGLSAVRVLQEGKKLSDNHLVKKVKVKGRTAYEKIDFFHTHKRRILALSTSPAKLAATPTKRTPAGCGIVVVRLVENRCKAKNVSIDDCDSFRLVREEGASGNLADAMSEKHFKQGLQRILHEPGEFQDWGGETCDLFSLRAKVRGKRMRIAFALKGPGTRGLLTPGKMGKNGDQIQRLIEVPADVFFVQYCRQIEPSVLKQLSELVMLKSQLTREVKYYGIIDGVDSKRLVKAYPKAFRK